jgi:hypothetical protein
MLAHLYAGYGNVRQVKIWYPYSTMRLTSEVGGR